MATAIKLSADRVTHVPPAKLSPDPNQPRRAFDPAELEALTDNVRQRGVQQPILVRRGPHGAIVIKAGERRWRAAKAAKCRTVPVLLISDGAESEVQRGLDQVAENSLRAALKPSDLAQFLVKLRDDQKLTANEIAARMAKDGMRAMSRSHVTNLMRLVELPDWAMTLLNEGKLDATAARGILAADRPAVMAEMRKAITQAINWRGRVTVKDVDHCLTQAHAHVGVDLKRTESYRSDAVCFDYRKVCKGCEHLKEALGGAWCMSKTGYAEHQAVAKAAGLGPGGKQVRQPDGKSDAKLTAAQERRIEKEKTAARTEQVERTETDYLHRWMAARLVAHVPDMLDATLSTVLDFEAAGAPGTYQQTWKLFNRVHEGARRAGGGDLVEFLDLESDDPTRAKRRRKLREAIVAAHLEQAPFRETLLLHRHVWGPTLEGVWRVGPDYLKLLRKAELAQVADTWHATLPPGRKAWGAAKASELVAAIVARAEAVRPPPSLLRLYQEVPEVLAPEDQDLDDEGLEDAERRLDGALDREADEDAAD